MGVACNTWELTPSALSVIDAVAESASLALDSGSTQIARLAVLDVAFYAYFVRVLT
jgi:hypothetical protein